MGKKKAENGIMATAVYTVCRYCIHAHKHTHDAQNDVTDTLTSVSIRSHKDEPICAETHTYTADFHEDGEGKNWKPNPPSGHNNSPMSSHSKSQD